MKTLTDDSSLHSKAAEVKLTSHFRGAKILLVEDDPIQSDIMDTLLDAVNLDITWAGDGIAALDLFDSGTFDLILMDIRMPRMDGLETTSRIRRLPSGNLPIVAVTANDIGKDSPAYIAAGFDDLLKKTG